MSWICKNCETENSDTLDICEVCETHAPKIVDFQYDKVLSGKPIIIRWKTEHCENVSIYYKGETINVSGKETYSIDTPDEQDISFMLSNSETTTRTVSFTMDFIERPRIEFASDKSKLKKDRKEVVALSWHIENAKSAILISGDDKIEIPLIGKQEVCPDVTSDYKIEALALDGETSFTERLQIGVFDECKIEFKADKNYIFPAIPVVLSWNVTNAKSIELDAELVEREGTKIVEPEKAAVYVLRAEDEFGIKEKRISIEMLPIPQVKSIMVPTPNIVSNMSISIQQPRYNVDVKIPEIIIDWIKFEVPKVPSLTELGLNKTLELSPQILKFNLMSSIKKVFDYIIRK